ncbi:MAG TPA: AtpZ/AtpI family protein [Candidatus Saccharimonadales bacterium]|nr:AtpZ/AtpI family protein [Candidatus Saccharimonadales bacterium]
MTSKAAAKTTRATSGEPTFGSVVIVHTFLDTTWRIAVPVVLFTLLGIAADRTFGTKPWLTLPSVVIGFVFAVLLVKRQLDAVAAEDRQ